MDEFDEKDRTCTEEDLLRKKRELEFALTTTTTTNNNGVNGWTENNYLELIDESLIGGTPPPPTRSLLTTTTTTMAVVTPPFPSTRQSYMSATSSRAGDPYARLATGVGGGTSRLMYKTASPTTNSHLLKHAVIFLLAVSSLPLVFYGVTLPTMQRLVYVGGPTLLHEILGMIWEKEYSIFSLVQTTGDAKDGIHSSC